MVTAIVKPIDHLKRRAEAFRAKYAATVSFSVGIELLFVAQKHGMSARDFVTAANEAFPLERFDVLLAAARVLDRNEIGTVFDAVHAATALVDGRSLVTTDKRILASDFPAVRF